MIRPLNSIRRWWKHDGVESDPVPVNGNGKSNGHPPVAAGDPPWVAHLERAGIPRSLVYPTTTLGRVLEQSADRFANASAVVYGATRWTYRELLSQVNRTAGGLASHGVRRGDRVLFALPNCPEFVTAFLAVQKLGAIAVNVGPLMGNDDLATVMSMTTPRLALGLDLQAGSLVHAGRGSTIEHWVWVSLQSYQPVIKRLGYQYKLWQSRNGNGDRTHHITLPDLLAQAPARPPTVEPDPDKPAVLQATGGTTGTLKLAQLTHRGLLANALQITSVMGCRPGQERFMAALPMFHVYGLTTCLVAPIFSAAEMVLMTRFHADEVLNLLRRERITVFPLVPAICSAVCDEIDRQEKKQQHKAPPLDAIRLCISGAAPLPVELAQRFTQMTGAPVVEGYGLTEASPVTHVNLPSRPKAGSIGIPLPDTHSRIVAIQGEGESPDLRDMPIGEAGELLVSGPQIMLGYFANPRSTRQSLVTDEHGKTWLRTGDIARMDEQGYFFVLDRKKDMIIRSGLKIFPVKVEHVLRRHPRVTDVAVVGRADPVHTEIVVAYVVAKPPSVKPDPHSNGEHLAQDRAQLGEELKALCREHLARYEVPAEIEFLDELPRSALGKLLKRELRNRPAAAPAPAPSSNGNGTHSQPLNKGNNPKEAV